MTENELERYMRLYYRSVYRTALCRCKDPQDADDVVQSAMERIEELLRVVNNETSIEDAKCIKLAFLSNLVADYEDAHYVFR